MPWLAALPRNQVNWGPTINPDTCVSCGMCMNCGKKVFEWIDNRPVVARYDDCVVGCTTCGNLCLSHAISFPNIEELRCLYRDHKVWSAVKKALIAEGKIPRGRTPQEAAAPDEEAC